MFKPRVEVHLWAGLRSFVDGAESVEVEARNVAELFEALSRDFPGLADIIDDGDGVSISIDGRVYADTQTEPIAEGQEIYLMQKMRGG